VIKSLRGVIPALLLLTGSGLVRLDAQSLGNLSTLSQTSPASPLTMGFVIANGPSKTVLIRAIGPTLGTAYNVPGVLPHPILNVFQGSSTTVVAGDDTWGGTPALTAVFQQVGAFALPANSLDAAVVVTLPAGTYTAQVTGKGVTTGTCLIEIYDVSGAGSQLVNLSSLLPIGTGAQTSFGFIVSPGSGTRELLIRAIGPGLSQFGVTGLLSDPNLSVYNTTSSPQQLVAQNDDWSSGNATSLSLSFTAAGAFALPNPSKDAAVVANFPPGNYGIQVTGNNGGTGTALVEIYDITPSGPNLVAVTASTPAADTTGSHPGVYTFTRIGALNQALTVAYSASGSAVSGADYAALPGVMTIPAGASSATLTLSPLPSINSNPSVTATLSLTAGSGYAIGTPGAATVTITEVPATLYTTTLRPGGSANASTASGTATILLNSSNTLALVSVSFTNLSASEVVAHLDLGTPGSSSVYVFNLNQGQVSDQLWTFGPTGPYSASDLISALKSGNIYVEVDSGSYPTGELTGSFTVAVGSQSFTAPAPPPLLPASALGPNTDPTNAVRLLSQASFGATTGDLATVESTGVTAWIKTQMAAPISSHLAAVRADAAAFANPQEQNVATYYYIEPVNQGAAWWKIALTGPDQLRQRVAFALSEIFVVSQLGAGLDHPVEALANYYDLLVNEAFGNYRQLLQDVTLNPVMGTYLSMLQNEKSNPALGTNADENYAREVQQLFSIGLVKLQPDGTLQLDATGQPIPTYDNPTIVQTANVFTGWSFASSNGNFFSNPLSPGIYSNPFPSTNPWLNPMQAYDAYHDTTAKTIVGGVVIPAGGTTTSDLKVMLDTLFNHPNTGPFICRQLIQHLVTSNPSPGYVYRVAQVFANDGTGTRGNLGAVVTAILSDYEARSATVSADVGYGKLREPLLRMSALLRAFNATPGNGRYNEYVFEAAQNGPYLANPTNYFEEGALQSSTVFNFFAPSYILPGALASAGLVAPEFQITDATSVINTPNALYTFAFNRTAPQPANLLTMDYSSLTALTGNLPALMAQLNLLFCGNAMTTPTSARIITALQALPSSATALQVGESALYLTISSPEAAIQR
jgi:uncharacterized protein (DUF1800 family)